MTPESLKFLHVVRTATLQMQLMKHGLRHCTMRGVRSLGAAEGRLVGCA